MTEIKQVEKEGKKEDAKPIGMTAVLPGVKNVLGLCLKSYHLRL